MTKQVYAEIMSSIGATAAEAGGILGISPDGIVRNYYYDFSGKRSNKFYTPDIDQINAILKQKWLPKNVFMVGIVHSHSDGNTVPSCGDIQYGGTILQNINTVPFFYLPIITFDSVGNAAMSCYVLKKSGNGTVNCHSSTYSLCEEFLR